MAFFLQSNDNFFEGQVQSISGFITLVESITSNITREMVEWEVISRQEKRLTTLNIFSITAIFTKFELRDAQLF